MSFLAWTGVVVAVALAGCGPTKQPTAAMENGVTYFTDQAEALDRANLEERRALLMEVAEALPTAGRDLADAELAALRRLRDACPQDAVEPEHYGVCVRLNRGLIQRTPQARRRFLDLSTQATWAVISRDAEEATETARELIAVAIETETLSIDDALQAIDAAATTAASSDDPARARALFNIAVEAARDAGASERASHYAARRDELSAR